MTELKPLGERWVGVVGLGMMGLPMAKRLAQGGERLALFDADAAKAAEAAAQTRGRVMNSAAELGALCDAVITILPNSAIVGQVLFGESGLAAGLRSGSLVIEMSSGLPGDTIRFGERLKEAGVAMVDAPVSGGVPRAVSGELTIMLGGDTSACDAARDVLRHLGNTILATGALGSGHAMKALNNLVSAGGFLIAAEALRVGQEFGLDGDTIVDVLNASTGMNNSTRLKLRQHVLSGKYASGFALDLMVKDLGIATGLADDLQLDVPFSRLCQRIWAEGARMLGPGADHTALARTVATPELSAALVAKAGGQ